METKTETEAKVDALVATLAGRFRRVIEERRAAGKSDRSIKAGLKREWRESVGSIMAGLEALFERAMRAALAADSGEDDGHTSRGHGRTGREPRAAGKP
jgi:hypothetical protein